MSEEAHKTHGWIWATLTVAVLLLYLLSYVPVTTLYQVRLNNRPELKYVMKFYGPADWIFRNTVLHKPLADFGTWFYAKFCN